MKKHLKFIIIIILISLFCEIFIFNISHFITLKYKDKSYDTKLVSKEKEFIKKYKDYEYTYTYEIDDINNKINNIYFDINADILHINVFLTDEANELYYDAGIHTYSSNISKSRYLKVHTSGKSKKVKLVITTLDKKLNLDKLIINKNVVFDFNFIRFGLLLLVVLSIYIFKRTKFLDFPFEKFKFKWLYAIIIAIVVVVGLSIFYNHTKLGKDVMTIYNIDYKNEYAFLAKSLKKGKFYLDIPVSDKLKELSNPYDTKYRDHDLVRNVDYYWDYAYYKGKYYVYFGIVPCLTMFLPYYLATGNDFNNVMGLDISCILYVIAAFYLVYELLNKYHKKVSFRWYLVFSLLVSFTSGLVFIVRDGGIYGIPILMGSAFAMLSIGFILRASLDDKKINTKYLLLSILFMALILGTRPQVIVTILLYIPILWKYLKNKDIFKIKNMLCIILPFLIIGGLLMYYNYARFGSFFDFGANYNLTTNDMTKRGFVFDRIFLGLYAFLFEVPRVSPIFPFIIAHPNISTYNGLTIYEKMTGGLFVTNILTILNLFIFKFKKLFKSKECFNVCLVSIITAFIILVADIQMAGIVPRYLCDFGFLINISTILILVHIFSNYKGNVNLIKKLVKIGIIITCIYSFLILFTHYLVDTSYSEFFYYIYYSFCFWV